MTTTKNDVTGDSIKSKPQTSKYSEGYAGINWTIKANNPVESPEIPSDKSVEYSKAK